MLRLKDDTHEEYILGCLMITNPEYFIPNSGGSLKKLVKTSTKSNIGTNNIEK